MLARPAPDEFAFDQSPEPPKYKSLLRFVACGSVDHGKSTLIGRLLYESHGLFEDQLDTLKADSRRFGTQGDELDFSLLLDGLAAEREQKITIDVAYRFFATRQRKYIVIDVPGHEQYTPNMATGASNADVALILVSAASGLTRQTRRHSLIVAMLGVKHVVLAVNKMDLVGCSEGAFRTIEAEFCEFAKDIGFDEITCVPVVAKSGDNIVNRSASMGWYSGPTLFDYLERVDISRAAERRPLRMPIQLINRPDPGFRGYSGLITSGEVHAGMPVRVLPSGRTSRIARIVTYDGDLSRATAGESVTLTLTEDIDASRGDVIADVEDAPAVTDRFSARIFWMNGTSLAPERSYLIKLATMTATVSVEPGLNIIDLDTQRSLPAQAIAQNEIGTCVFTLDRKVAADRYADARETGGFILIDPESFDTVGIGCIEDTQPAKTPNVSAVAGTTPEQTPVGGHAARRAIARWRETHARSIAKAVSWRATGSLDTFVVAFVITGSSKLAGSVALTEVLTKILIYYCHERLWSLVPWGKR